MTRTRIVKPGIVKTHYFFGSSVTGKLVFSTEYKKGKLLNQINSKMKT